MTVAPRSGWLAKRAPRLVGLAVGIVLGALGAAPAQAQTEAEQGGQAPSPSSLAYAGPLRQRVFLSLKADSVHLRKGPGRDQPTAWVLQRLGLPVEVVEQHQGWSKVVDASGAAGWVDASFLSRRRTALITPWEIREGQPTPLATLREDDRDSASAVAQVEAGVLASIIACGGGWCRVSVGSYRGYIEQGKLWGTYPGEQVN